MFLCVFAFQKHKINVHKISYDAVFACLIPVNNS